jgi:hypothetical protein
MSVRKNESDKGTQPKETDHEKELRRARWLFGIILGALLLVAVWWILIHLSRAPRGGLEWARADLYNSPPWQWYEWLLSSLIGALLYALVNIAYWYHQKHPRFVAFTPWYISTILKGPIVAFIIMLFVTSVSLEISGLDVDFADMNRAPLLVAAFALGFYSRVAREQLNLIVKALFSKAYSRAEEEFSIAPQGAQVRFGQTVVFRTVPTTDVTWLASAGKIENGTYTAPKKEDAKSGQVVQITAVPEDPDVPRATAELTLVPFEIVGKDRIAYEATESYQVAPEQAGGVTWAVSPEIRGSSIDDKGVYKAPTEARVDKATIKAISKDKPEDFATLDVYFKEPEGDS